MNDLRMRYAWITVAACLAAAGCGSTNAQSLNLEAARRLVSGSSEARSLGKIDLSGLEFAREVDLGQGLRVIVVSGSRSGGAGVPVRRGGWLARDTTIAFRRRQAATHADPGRDQKSKSSPRPV